MIGRDHFSICTCSYLATTTAYLTSSPLLAPTSLDDGRRCPIGVVQMRWIGAAEAKIFDHESASRQRRSRRSLSNSQ
jgi:hypothetical protein